MEHYSRSYRDLLQWNPILKKTYFEYHPTDKKMYRTYQPVFRPFGGMNDEGEDPTYSFKLGLWNSR